MEYWNGIVEQWNEHACSFHCSTIPFQYSIPPFHSTESRHPQVAQSHIFIGDFLPLSFVKLLYFLTRGTSRAALKVLEHPIGQKRLFNLKPNLSELFAKIHSKHSGSDSALLQTHECTIVSVKTLFMHNVISNYLFIFNCIH